jgi:hypothetical protein
VHQLAPVREVVEDFGDRDVARVVEPRQSAREKQRQNVFVTPFNLLGSYCLFLHKWFPPKNKAARRQYRGRQFIRQIADLIVQFKLWTKEKPPGSDLDIQADELILVFEASSVNKCENFIAKSGCRAFSL